MTKVLAGFQKVKTLEDIYREGDPDLELKFDNTAGIKAINSVFYRRKQEELDDSADAQLLRHSRPCSTESWQGTLA